MVRAVMTVDALDRTVLRVAPQRQPVHGDLGADTIAVVAGCI
jgi:hypothetical protein